MAVSMATATATAIIPMVATNKMDIVYCCDQNYFKYALVSALSVAENTARKCTFWIIVDSALTNANRTILDRFTKVCYATVRIVIPDKASLPPLHFAESDRLTIPAYYRLFIADWLPEVDRIIYLDCDTLAVGDIFQVWNFDLGEKTLGAVDEFGTHAPDSYTRLGYPQQNGYFNSGVLLLNLASIRNLKIVEKYVSALRLGKATIRFHDQDVLNLVHACDKVELPARFNLLDTFAYRRNPLIDPVKLQELHHEFRHAVLVHFSALKPWNGNCLHPYASLYNSYAARMGVQVAKPRVAGNLKFYFKKLLFKYNVAPHSYIKMRPENA